MTKHLVDIDDEVLRVAQAELHTNTIKATVNEALLRTGEARRKRVEAALDFFATADLLNRFDRSKMWRGDT